MRFNLLLFFLLCYTSCVCQAFGDKNAVWVYNHNGWVPGITKVQKDRDTLVNGRQVKIFTKTAYRKLYDGEIIRFDLLPVYIREDAGVIEYSERLTHFDTLYNFDLSIGETWTIPERDILTGQPTGLTIERTLVDTFTLNINGAPIFCQGVRAFQNNYIDTIYQNTGTRTSYILPFDFRAIAADGGEGGVLRCYTDDIVGLVEYEYPFTQYDGGSFSDFEYDCDQLNSIFSIPISNEDISVFPNPASSIIHIQSDREDIRSLIFYNLQGVLILEKQGHGDTLDLDISDIPSGMYFVLINGSYFEKVILER